MKVKFVSNNLGDKIATIYSMENCGRQTGLHFTITGHSLAQEVCDLFNLQHVNYTINEDNSVLTGNIKVERKGVLHIPFAYRLMRYLEDNYNYSPEKSVPLTTRDENQHYVVCQFDNRLAEREGFKLKPIDILKIIKSKTNKNEVVFVIGGPETNTYVSKRYEYRLGNLTYLFNVILHADRFIGADSGMAHLAGAVGLPSEVCCLMPKYYDYSIRDCVSDEINPCYPEFFERSYRGMTCFIR